MNLPRNQYQRNSSWNAPYTFSGKEKDAETGYSYFGARYYDSGLSIWLSVDPMSDKYPSMSPYNYCANNPVILVDPDGRDIILFDEFNRKVATFTKNGITIEVGMKGSSTLKNFNSSVSYIGENSDVFKDAINSESIINIHCGDYENKATVKEGTPLRMNNGKQVASSVDVYWNPKLAMETSSGGSYSPAMMLTHEMVHTNSYITDFKATMQNMDPKTAPSGYPHIEEFNTIQTINNISKNYKFETSNRNDHGGTYYNSIGVTSTADAITTPTFTPSYTPQDRLRMPYIR